MWPHIALVGASNNVEAFAWLGLPSFEEACAWLTIFWRLTFSFTGRDCADCGSWSGTETRADFSDLSVELVEN